LNWHRCTETRRSEKICRADGCKKNATIKNQLPAGLIDAFARKQKDKMAKQKAPNARRTIVEQ
jgi:hypothetical protein